MGALSAPPAGRALKAQRRRRAISRRRSPPAQRRVSRAPEDRIFASVSLCTLLLAVVSATTESRAHRLAASFAAHAPGPGDIAAPWSSKQGRQRTACSRDMLAEDAYHDINSRSRHDAAVSRARRRFSLGAHGAEAQGRWPRARERYRALPGIACHDDGQTARNTMRISPLSRQADDCCQYS